MQRNLKTKFLKIMLSIDSWGKFSNIVYCQSHGKANIMRALQYTIPE